LPLLFSKAIEKMEQGKDWMPMDHAGSGISHHSPDFLPHTRLVAVNRASGAGGLVLLERAAIEALVRIRQESHAGTA
jgi:hypothetical protein